MRCGERYIILHRRGAFGVARSDGQGNARAFRMWGERQCRLHVLFCVCGRNYKCISAKEASRCAPSFFMGLLVYKFSDYEYTAEREQYRNLCKQLQSYYGSKDELCIFIANYNIYDCELDGLLIKQDSILVVEFKNYGGCVTAVDNGEWKLSDGTVIKGGSRKTLYKQIHINHAMVRGGLKDGNVITSKSASGIAALVVFHQPITLDNKLSARTRSWLHVCDETTFMEKVQDITSKSIEFNRRDMLSIIEKMALDRDYLDETYSNAEILDERPQDEEEETLCPDVPQEKSGETTEGQSVLTAQSGTPAAETENEPEAGRDMQNTCTLPKWLDDYIFNELGAKYCRSNSDMTVIDWDKSDVLNYLGTYFPRSYTEAYCIFSEYFSRHKRVWADKETLSVFDFGCGTGGEIIGMAMAAKEQLPWIDKITGIALDGNHHALRIYSAIEKTASDNIGISIGLTVAPTTICNFYDLSVVSEIVDRKFDIIMSFKAICEFVTKERFEQENAYRYISSVLFPKLNDGGIMLMVDVSTYNNTSKEWLPIMMDKGFAMYNIVGRNDGFNQCFYVSHSMSYMDTSKVAWRLMKR